MSSLQLVMGVLGLFFTSVTHAQKSLALLGGFDMGGFTKGYRFSNGGDVLKTGDHGTYYAGNGNEGIRLQYQPNPYFGMEGGILFSEVDVAVYDNSFLTKNNLSTYSVNGSNSDGKGYLGFAKTYLTPQVSLYGYLPLNGKQTISLYVAGGLCGNFLIPGQHFQQSYAYTPTQEYLRLTGSYSRFFESTYLETGVKISKKLPMYFSYKTSFSNPMMQADYSDVQNGKVISSDQVSVTGGFHAVTFWMGFNFWHKKSKQKKHASHSTSYHHKGHRTKTPSEVSKKKKATVPGKRLMNAVLTPLSENIPVVKQSVLQDSSRQNGDTIPSALAGRQVKILKRLILKASAITLQVWDNEAVDGDVLSLIVDGQIVVQNYSLQTKPYLVPLVLLPGTHYITMQAEKVGKRPPCTAAMLVNDGFSQQTVLLNSDFTSSSTLELFVEE